MADRLQQVQTITTLRQLQMTNNNGECRPVLISEDELSIAPRSRTQYEQQDEKRAVASARSNSGLQITSKEQTMLWYQGIFGVVAIREKWINTRRIGSRTDGKTVSAQKVLTVTSPFLRRAVELYFGKTFASVPTALRVYQMVNGDAPIFQMCAHGDLDGIQNEVAKGTFSPFVVDQFGWTLLHVVCPVISLVFKLIPV